MLGILLVHDASPWISPLHIWLITLGLLLPVTILYHFQHTQWPLGMLLLLTSLGALVYAQTRLPVEQLYPVLENLAAVRSVVVNYPDHRPERSSFVIQPQGMPGFLQIFYYHPSGKYKTVHYGDELELSARFEMPWQFEDFDYREYLQTRNIWGVGSLWSAQGIRVQRERAGSPILHWGYEARLQVFARIDRHIPQPASGLLKGLLFGERAYLSEGIEMSFRDAGVMHVLAVSGLNLGILLGLFWAALRLFRFSATQIYLVLPPMVFLYLLLVGFEVSLVRASLMLGFVAMGWVIAERGWILKRWIDPLQGLSVAALLILIWTPSALFDVSFQLSFAATAGILLVTQIVLPLWQEHRERLRMQWKVDSSLPRRILFRGGEMTLLFLLISLAAQLAVAPLLAHHFHRVYLGALLANLAVVPLATAALWLGVPFLLASTLAWVPVAAVLGNLECWLLERLIDVTDFFAHLPGAYLVLEGGMHLVFLVALPLIFSPAAWSWVTGWIISRQRSLGSP